MATPTLSAGAIKKFEDTDDVSDHPTRKLDKPLKPKNINEKCK